MLSFLRLVICLYKEENEVVTSEQEEYIRLPLPNRNKNEMFAIADQLMGGSRIKVVCADGKARMARIPGRMKRRQRVRAGDLVIINPGISKMKKQILFLDIVRTQAMILSRRKLIPEEIDVF